jgi:hypothetical protein
MNDVGQNDQFEGLIQVTQAIAVLSAAVFALSTLGAIFTVARAPENPAPLVFGLAALFALGGVKAALSGVKYLRSEAQKARDREFWDA